MRILIVQFAGDFLEAASKLRNSGGETYYGHSYVLGQLERFSKAFGQAGILCCLSGRRFNQKLPSDVIVIGENSNPESDFASIKDQLVAYDPTHLVVLGPMPKVIRWGLSTGRRVICIFADSFNTNIFHRFLKYGRLGSLLNDRRLDWIANHGLNSCVSLYNIGVDRRKIIPWDWPHVRRPDDLSPKSADYSNLRTLVFAGAVITSKGIGDVISAVALLKRHGRPVRLNIAGGGEIQRFQNLAAKLDVSKEVTFHGVVPNGTVFEMMRNASLVVIPSHHSYPEGLPLTIYEAFCSRSPIVASDHPMFANRLVDNVNALIYRSGKYEELAHCVETLLSNRNLYERLSSSSQSAWQELQIATKWGDLIYRWVRDLPDDREWLLASVLDSPQYTNRLMQ